ncbi:MAG TPA: DUF1761 domain-containing protein [Nocardioidaceae bacterium]|nr:DUF1761 domain-containing protein [Nocardioidaceae bacterium]
MLDLNILAALLAAVGAFMISGAYYAALGTQLARLSPAYAEAGRSTAATNVVELMRNLVLAGVVSGLAAGLGLDSFAESLLLALALWVGFPVVLLVGSVFHERVPPMLAAMHSGDWFLKLVAVAGVVTVWR